MLTLDFRCHETNECGAMVIHLSEKKGIINDRFEAIKNRRMNK